MRQVSRRAVVAAAVGSALLAGCTSTVAGTAAPPITDATADQVEVVAATDSDVDRRVRNALADLEAFWTEAYPQYFGEEFTKPEGGYFAVDSSNLDESLYPETGVGCERLPIDPSEAAGNAFYHPACDVIVYDSVRLQIASDDHGPYLGPAIMAHEYGHAMQGRFGFADEGIRVETQADCLAGAFTRWVVDGNAAHTTLRIQDLDDVLVGFLELRDPLGLTDVDVEGAHGSGFDRATAFYEGYSAVDDEGRWNGVGACRDNYGEDRVFTLTDDFVSREDLENEGNAPYADLPDLIDGTIPEFFQGSWLEGFEQPAIEVFDGTAPDCGDMGAEDRDVGWCEADNTVYVDETDLLMPAYDQIGDYAAIVAVALPYAEAARAHRGLPADDAGATRSIVCLTGSYTAAAFNGDFVDPRTDEGVRLSPGDVDEAIVFLLTYGQTDAVLPNTDATGFQLLGAFQDGFRGGAQACDI